MRLQEAPLGSLTRIFAAVVLCAALSAAAAAQETPKLQLDTDAAVFTVLTGINACGYNEDLDTSVPLRQQIRSEVAVNVARTPEAQEALQRLCRFYKDHQQPEPSRDLAQYVSLALNLDQPPTLSPKSRESDLPPDAVYVLGAVPLLQNFYITADLSGIWRKHQRDYESLITEYHKPIADMVFSTDIYLKQQMSSYVGRSFSIVIDPMGAPGQVNARNYGENYYLVVSPGTNGLKLDQIRHTYLHYIIDPLSMKRANSLKRLQPLLDVVKDAPLDDSYKYDISLLTTESLIRAVEARLIGGAKGAEAPREVAVDTAMKQGFVLTRYFYDQLIAFEKNPVGLKDAYGDWLYNLYLPKEMKQARQITWSAPPAPEVVRSAARKSMSLADQAENQLSSGNLPMATKLAQQALDKNEDAGRALFVLARAATLSGDMEGAKSYFERTLQASPDPKIVAWSHIYLGRILDMSEERESALLHYKAALQAGEITPETRAAAERGIKEPYQPKQGKN